MMPAKLIYSRNVPSLIIPCSVSKIPQFYIKYPFPMLVHTYVSYYKPEKQKSDIKWLRTDLVNIIDHLQISFDHGKFSLNDYVMSILLDSTSIVTIL